MVMDAIVRSGRPVAAARDTRLEPRADVLAGAWEVLLPGRALLTPL